MSHSDRIALGYFVIGACAATTRFAVEAYRAGQQGRAVDVDNTLGAFFGYLFLWWVALPMLIAETLGRHMAVRAAIRRRLEREQEQAVKALDRELGL